MAFEMLVGLKVKNDELYSSYRKAMAPILEKFGGGFRYDFKISEVLKNESGNEMNRVFTIFFRDQDAKKAFFADSEYLKVRAQYFEPSVHSSTIISEYER